MQPSLNTRKRLALIGNQAASMLNFRGSLIQAMVRRGHEVYAFAPDFDDLDREAMRALGATPVDHAIHRIGVNPLADALGTADLIGKLRSIRPDVALGYSVKPATYGLLAAFAAGVPKRFALIEGLGHVFIERGSIKSWALKAGVKALYKSALARTDRTFFLNPDDHADFLRLGLVTADKSEVLGGIGVDLGKWHPAPPVVKPMTFLFIGRLLREKGISELIEAIRMVKSDHPEVQFVLLGDIDRNPSSVARKEAESWVTDGLVAWPGQVDVAPWIARSSVFVLPSYREGLPRSTQEAMAMARPVITTDVPGCRQTVIDGINGYLVPARDPVALAKAMLRFVHAPEQAATMGEASRALAEQCYDGRKINEKFINKMGL